MSLRTGPSARRTSGAAELICLYLMLCGQSDPPRANLIPSAATLSSPARPGTGSELAIMHQPVAGMRHLAESADLSLRHDSGTCRDGDTGSPRGAVRRATRAHARRSRRTGRSLVAPVLLPVLLSGKGHFRVTSCGHYLRHRSELGGLPCQQAGRRGDMRLPACKRSKIISRIEIFLWPAKMWILGDSNP